MNTKQILFGGAILLVFIAFIIIKPENKAKNNGDITIGGAVALTGFASAWGEVERNGALLAIEDLKKEGVNINFLVEDIQSSNAKTLSAIKKLINIDNAEVIFGPTWMDTFGSATPLSEQEDIIIISPSSAITAVESESDYSNVYSMWYRSDAELQMFPDFIKKEGYTKIAIIISTDSFWEDVVLNFKIGAKENDLEIVDVIKVNPETADLRTQIAKLKQLDADAVFFGFSSEQNLSSFLKQKNVVYPDIQLLTTESIEEFIEHENFGELLNGTIYVAPEMLDSDFSRRYTDRFGVNPIFSATNAYDTIMILAEALRNTDRTSLEIRKYLDVTEFNTVTFGKVRFDEIGGVTNGKFVVKKIEDGEIIIISEI